MYKTIEILIILLVLVSCNDKDDKPSEFGSEQSRWISAVDVSSLPEILESEPKFYDIEGNQNDFITIIKDNGINTIRLRLWVNPENQHSGFDEVKAFSKELKDHGLKIWLSLHYSDTWADPAHQKIPNQWQGSTFNQLLDSVYSYTQNIISELNPDYVQIGNEINNGFLHPQGNISSNYQQFIELMKAAILAVRTNTNSTEIILHFAGIEGSDWFFDQSSQLDFDIIGLSFYPIWHGKSLDALKSKMSHLSDKHNKQVLIAETAYPFTLEWNDWTNNIVGLEDQLILPEYPATIDGQRKFIKEIKTITKNLKGGIGFCYWGAELISWKGNESKDASPWENQALFDFDNTALPALIEFGEE